MSLALDDFSTRLADLGLFDQAELRDFLSSLPEAEQPQDAESFLQALVRGKRLTTYQARQIGSGQGQSLVLGNYVILDKLGQGGMGEVFKAQHLRMQRVVAIKLLTAQVTTNPDALKRFQREVVAAARLVHPNIVTAYDADEAKGMHFLVMEHVAGRDLARLVRETGTLSVPQAARCILQAARGLEYAHQQGVIHRDVKPSNLLLEAGGGVKVLDLGLARLDSIAGKPDELTWPGDVMGTVDYMAPEQAENTKLADARSDIYSLGMSLWFLLTGRPTYESDSLAAKIMAHRTAPIPSLAAARPEATPALNEVFQKLVAKDPRERYQTMAEVIAALERCLGELGDATQALSDDNELTVRLANITKREEETVVFVKPTSPSTHRLEGLEPTLQMTPRSATEQRPAERNRTPLTLALAFVGGAAMILLTVFLLMPGRGDNVLIEVTDSEVELTIDQGKVKIVGVVKQKLTLEAGQHELTVKRGEAELAEKFVVAKGKGTTLQVEVVDGILQVKQDGKVLGSVALAPPPGTNPPPVADVRHKLEFAPGTKVEIASLKLDRAGALTLEAYVTPGESADGKPGVLLGTPLQFALHLDPQTNRLSLESNHADGEHRVGPIEIAPERRLHVAAVRAANEHRLYVQGILVGREKIESPLVESDAPFTMGGQFAGSVEEVRVSNVPRYDEGFAPAERFEPDTETLALYHVTDGSGEVLADASGNNHTGKIEGANWIPSDLSLAPANAPINLLQNLDPAKDGLVHDPADNTWKPGKWQTTPEGLKSGNARREIYRLPVDSLPPSYSLLVDFELAEGDGALLGAFTVGASQCYLVVNGSIKDVQRQAGFGEVDGKWDDRNETTVLHPSCKLGERHVLKVDVLTNGDDAELTAELDGKRFTSFKGKAARLRLAASEIYDSRPPKLGVGSMLAPYLFHRVELTDLSRAVGRAEAGPPPAAAVAPFDATQAKQHQAAWAKHLGVPVEFANSLGMKFVLIPPGEFTMGGTPEEIEDVLNALRVDPYVANDENYKKYAKSAVPRHKVVLTRAFYLGVHEVTQQEFKSIIGKNPSCFAATGRRPDLVKGVAGLDTVNFPVEDVSWNDAVEFCDKLGQREGLTPFDRRAGENADVRQGVAYRLPTEAEWEFACRAGTTTRHWRGDQHEEVDLAAWTIRNFGGRTHSVGELKPNPFGLFDILGNVWEWVEDGWDPAFYAKFGVQPAIDPYHLPLTDSPRIHRGSCWYFAPPICTSSVRAAAPPTKQLESIGFRVVLPVETVKKALSKPASITPQPATNNRSAAEQPKLKTLHLIYTSVTDRVLSALDPLENLTDLNLFGAKVTEPELRRFAQQHPKNSGRGSRNQHCA